MKIKLVVFSEDMQYVEHLVNYLNIHAIFPGTKVARFFHSAKSSPRLFSARAEPEWRYSGLPGSWAVIWNWRSGSSPRANVKGRAGHAVTMPCVLIPVRRGTAGTLR